MPGGEGVPAASIGEEAAVVREKMEAIRSFESRLEADPQDSQALERLGMLQLEVGYQHRALETFERLVEISPMDATARFWFARALASVGRKDDALVEKRIGSRLLEQEEKRDRAAREEVVEKGEPGEVMIVGRPGIGPKESAIPVVLPQAAPLKVQAGEVKPESPSPNRFGLEEALILVASLGMLVLFVNILARI
ncbi:MAG TPA: BTAD domain-containing putative transcriptional regulator [Thermoplasmata archaeon]|nr:BTAD domain-containing putative transcriptional regulator [Thermoplasmata archaeon]